MFYVQYKHFLKNQVIHDLPHAHLIAIILTP